MEPRVLLLDVWKERGLVGSKQILISILLAAARLVIAGIRKSPGPKCREGQLK